MYIVNRGERVVNLSLPYDVIILIPGSNYPVPVDKLYYLEEIKDAVRVHRESLSIVEELPEDLLTEAEKAEAIANSEPCDPKDCPTCGELECANHPSNVTEVTIESLTGATVGIKSTGELTVKAPEISIQSKVVKKVDVDKILNSKLSEDDKLKAVKKIADYLQIKYGSQIKLDGLLKRIEEIGK